jgi:hypothetical protein
LVPLSSRAQPLLETVLHSVQHSNAFLTSSAQRVEGGRSDVSFSACYVEVVNHLGAFVSAPVDACERVFSYFCSSAFQRAATEVLHPHYHWFFSACRAVHVRSDTMSDAMFVPDPCRLIAET